MSVIPSGSTMRVNMMDLGADVIGNSFCSVGRALEEPRKWTPDLPELLRDGFAGAPDPLPELGSRLSREASIATRDLEGLAIEHARLFMGPFDILVPPWASIYLESGSRLMGATSQYVARCYADAGLAPVEGLHEAPDHVTHELEYMYYLAFKEIEEGDDRWRALQVTFWRNHLSQWLHLFAATLAKASHHPFYEGLAATLAVLCRHFDEGYNYHCAT